MLLVEHKYKDAQEEADNLRELVKKLRVKYKAALEEIQDLEQEHETQREDLFDTIRAQEKELKLLNKINEIMLTPQEFYKIKSKSDYNEDKMEWKVPMFIVKNKKVALPSVNGKRAVEADKANRDLHFESDTRNHNTNTLDVHFNPRPLGELSASPNRHDFKWRQNDLNASNTETHIKHNHKKNVLSLTPMDHFDNPMELTSRRKKYLRNSRFEEEIAEAEKLKRKPNGKISLAPLNHTAIVSPDDPTAFPKFRLDGL